MTPAEATAVNVLFGYLAAQDPAPPAAVIRSLETIASRVHDRLQFGVSEESIREQCPEMFGGGWSRAGTRRSVCDQ